MEGVDCEKKKCPTNTKEAVIRGCYTTTPDFVKLAGAFGIEARRVSRKDEVGKAISHAIKYDGPHLIEFLVAQEENVMPMRPPGKGVEGIID